MDQRTTTVLGCVLCAAVIALLPARPAAHGETSDRATALPTVVTINLENVLDQLDETIKIRQHFAQLDAAIREHDDTKRALIQQLQDEAELLEPGSEVFRQKFEQSLSEAANLNAWLQVRRGIRDREETFEYLRMYDAILSAAAELAEAEGYDFVLLDDTTIPITPSTPEETVAQLFTRRMIYKNPDRDVTDLLVTRMNNAYNAGE